MKLSKLINKGLITVYGPLISFVIICGFVANWTAKNKFKIDEPSIIVALTVFFAIIVGWTWWSYRIVKWKYWAFSQIDTANSIKLYTRAIEVGLIWPKGSVFNKTEIWTNEDKRKWKSINPEIQAIFKDK